MNRPMGDRQPFAAVGKGGASLSAQQLCVGAP